MPRRSRPVPVFGDSSWHDAVLGGFLAYGLVSLAGLVGFVLGRRYATPIIVVPQAIVAAGLVAVYLLEAADRSLSSWPRPRAKRPGAR